MAEYFIDPYVKYYNNLQNVSSLATNVTSINDELTTISNNVNKLSSQIDASRWKELGQESISTTILPTLKERVTSLSGDVTGILQQAVSKATELYQKVTELKESDEKLETSKAELKTLKNNEPSYSSGIFSGSESSAHSNWRSNVSNKEKKCNTLINTCKTLQNDANSLVTAINSLEVSEEPAEVVVEAPQEEGVNVSTLNGMISYNFDGDTYYVANTQYSLDSYLRRIDKNNIAQQYSSNYSGKCLGFTYIHTYDLYTGYGNHTGDDADNGSSPFSISQLQTWDKNEAIQKIVTEVSNGRPAIVQVNGKKHKNGRYSRHFVTVVGIKESAVKSGNITESDFLILDSYDGDLRTLDTSKSKYRFMTRGADTGNGDYGYYVISMRDSTKVKT